MRSVGRRTLFPAACVALALGGGVAHAQAVGPDGAQTLARDLTGWLDGLIGRNGTAQGVPLQVTAEGDHYRVALPITGITTKGGPPTLSVAARPQSDGTWTIDDLHVPAEASFTLNPAAMGIPGKLPGQAVPAGPMTARVRIVAQQTHAVIDPTLRKPSDLDMKITGFDFDTTGPQAREAQHVDQYDLHAALTPGADGRLTLAEQGELQGWRVAARNPKGPAVVAGAARLRASMTIGGVDRARVVALATAIADLGSVWPSAATIAARRPLPPAARAALRKVVLASRDILRSVHLQEALDDFQLSVGGFGSAKVHRLHVGFGGTAPDGKLHAWVAIALKGLAIEGLPPPASALLPQEVVLRPSVSDLKLAALTQLALDATAEHPDDSRWQPDLDALFADGGFAVGLEAFSLTVGPAHLTGKGSLRLLSPSEMKGHARLVASGFDALMQSANTDPGLKEMLPMLAMARGMAKPDGDRLVWDIASTPDGAITINGMPFGAPGGHRPSKPVQ